MDSVRPNWKNEVICIKNKVNKALEDMTEVRQLNSYFDPSHRICAHEFYAPFRSSKVPFDPSTKTINEYRQWLLNIRDGGETQLFLDEIDRIVKEENKKFNPVLLADHVKQAPLGVKTIGPHLQEISMNIFAKQLPVMKEKLLKEISRYNQLSEELQSELDSLDENKAKDLYWEFITVYVRNLRSLITFRTEYGDEDMKVVDPNQFRMTFKDEYNAAHNGQPYFGKIIPLYDDLEKKVNQLHNTGATGLSSQLIKALCGEAAKNRLVEVVMHLILELEMINMDDDTLYNAVNSCGHGVCQMDAEKGLHALLEPSVRNMRIMVDWIINHVAWLLKKHSEDAIVTVIENANNPRFRTIKERHGHFIDHVDAMFESLVHNQTDRIHRSTTELIKDHSVTIDIYEPYSLLIVLAKADYFPKLLLNDISTTSGSTGGGSFFDILSNIVKTSTSLTGDKVIDAVSQLSSVAKSTSLSAPVQVGPLIAGDSNNFDAQQIRATAKQHFYVIKNLIARRVKTIIHAQYQYFINDHINEFNQAMVKFVSNLSVDDIKQKIADSNAGINDLQQNAQQVKQSLNELNELKKAIEDLERENRMAFASKKSKIGSLFNNNGGASASSAAGSSANGAPTSTPASVPTPVPATTPSPTSAPTTPSTPSASTPTSVPVSPSTTPSPSGTPASAAPASTPSPSGTPVSTPTSNPASSPASFTPATTGSATP